MRFGDRIASTLPALQAADESRMSERFVIDRPTGSVVDDDGDVVTEYVVVYDGPGRIPPYFPHPQTPGVGDAETLTIERAIWRIPAPERIPVLLAEGRVAVWAGSVAPGDRARRMSTAPVETARVVGQHAPTQATAIRLIVDDITGGRFA